MSSPFFVDIHTHVNFSAFHDDYGDVIRRSLDAGVWTVNVGTQKDTSKRAVEIAREFPEGVYATVGLHPIHTEKSYHDEQELGGGIALTSRGEEFDYEYYKPLAHDKKVVAIGECGLDYYRLGEETKKRQREAFETQIAFAHEVKKPLMIHCRSAFPDLIVILQTNSRQLLTSPGMIHFFSGATEHARTLLDAGFSFSFGGVITFVREYDAVIQYIPLDRIVLETDAPYVTPAPYRGKRNEPIFVLEVAKKLAELKKVSFEKIAEKTTENARAIFGI